MKNSNYATAGSVGGRLRLSGLLALLLSPALSWAQTTYTWVGGAGTNWSTAGNWTPARNTRAATDILQFDGGTHSITLNVDETLRQLRFLNNATVTLNLPASGNNNEITRTFAIVGDGTAAGNTTDLEVAAGASLTVVGGTGGGNSNGSSLDLALGTNATATIAGPVVLDGTGAGGNANTRIYNRLTGTVGSIVFQSGGSLTVRGAQVLNDAAPFGSSPNGTATFQSGSSFTQQRGADPYGPAVFQAGSTYTFTGGAVPASLTGRTYGSLVYDYPTSAGLVYGGNNRLTILNDLRLTANNASTVELTITGNAPGGVAIGGNITVDGGALSINPNSDVSLRLDGTTPQTISGAGTFFTNTSTLSLVVDNPAGVTLLKPLTFKGLTIFNGIVTTSTGNELTLALGNQSNGTSLAVGSASGFVSGPLNLTTSGANSKVLSFPIGARRNGVPVYRPVRVDLTQTSATGTYSVVQVEGGSAANRPATGELQRVSGVRIFSLTTPNTTFTNATVTLSYGADDQVNDAASLRVARSVAGGAWTSMGGTGTGATTGTIASSVTMTALGDFALGTTSPTISVNPLPVELLDFSAERREAGALLKWSTALEKNSAYFEVQRSRDGRTFETIGQVAAQGHSTRTVAYSFVDKGAAGLVYYRLHQVDLDGTATDSKIVTVSAAEGLLAAAYPNPVQQQLHLVLGAEPVQWRILNLLGQPVRQGKAQAQATLDLTSLPAGSYRLEVSNGSKRTVRAIVKTN